MENQRRFWLTKPRPVSFESEVTNAERLIGSLRETLVACYSPGNTACNSRPRVYNTLYIHFG